MKSDSLQEYVSIRNSLLKERHQITARLSALDEALGALPTPSQSAIDGATSSPAEKAVRRKKGKPGTRQMSPEARERIAAAARKRWAAAKKSGRSRL